MKPVFIPTLLASVCLCGAAVAQTQTSPPSSQPAPSTSPSQSAAPPSNSGMSPSSQSGSQPVQQDTSRGAKEQQSQKQKCPSNGDNSNVNCKHQSTTSGNQ